MTTEALREPHGTLSAAIAVMVLAGAVILAFAQRAIAGELERRGLIRGVWPQLRHAWFTAGSGMVAVGVFWLWRAARAIGAGGVQRYLVQLTLIAVGAVLALLHRPGADQDDDR